MSEESKINYDEFVLNLTQEIARKGEEIPERYILKENVIISPPIDASPTLWEDTLLIDYSLLSTDPNQLAKLHYALKHWGCFQPNLYPNLYPEDQRQLKIWPQNPPKFREIVEEYALKIVKMGEEILKAMAKSMGLKEDSFLKKQAERASMNTKFSYYPPCSRPDRVLGARPHKDPSTLTILLPDDKVEGLHIQKDDKWYNVPINTGAIFINLGDAAEVMSNGIFKSVLHRVVTNKRKERVSIAAFFMPGPNAEIGPIDELITTTGTQVYKKVDLPTYRKFIFQSIGPDTRLLNSLKL